MCMYVFHSRFNTESTVLIPFLTVICMRNTLRLRSPRFSPNN